MDEDQIYYSNIYFYNKTICISYFIWTYICCFNIYSFLNLKTIFRQQKLWKIHKIKRNILHKHPRRRKLQRVQLQYSNGQRKRLPSQVSARENPAKLINSFCLLLLVSDKIADWILKNSSWRIQAKPQHLQEPIVAKVISYLFYHMKTLYPLFVVIILDNTVSTCLFKFFLSF